jgi:hypothetical protein
MNLVRTHLLGFLVIVLTAFRADGASPSDFQQVLKHPNHFDGRRVTLVGVADIGGSEFFLYPDIRSAKHGDSEKAIFVETHILDKNPYEQFHNHWVKITGIVDMRVRPPLGVGPCSVVFERLEPLALPPLHDTSVKAVFKNDTGEMINVKFSAPSGAGYILRFPSGDVSAASVIKRGVITAKTRMGKLIATGDLIPKFNTREFFDVKARTYYYRIRPGKIELVPVREGQQWRTQKG